MALVTCNFDDTYFIHQQEPRSCWFATYLMATQFINKNTIDYNNEKTKIQSENFYTNFLSYSGDPFNSGGDAFLIQACFNTYNISYNFKYHSVTGVQEFIQYVSLSLNAGCPVIIAINKGYDHYILCVAIEDNGQGPYTEITYYDPESSDVSQAKKYVKLSDIGSRNPIKRINEYLYKS